ncbi:MAG: DUF1294 domain-containing protein [Lachnospiraceae bacterium]|nr:DUF1294 domain-containing protein [Lachnospiraceae bacterium]
MKEIWLIIIIYLVAVNLLGLILMGVDKSRAKRRKWRIPEATLFLVAVIGGALGSTAGMYIFRHKTKHWYFVIGMPAILVIHLIAAAILYFAPLNLIFL